MSGLNGSPIIGNQRYTVYKEVNAGGDTILVPVTANKRFLVHYVNIYPTTNVTLAAAGRTTCSITDGAGGTTICAFQQYFLTAVTSNPVQPSRLVMPFDVPYKSESLGNDIISNFSTALLTGRFIINIIYSLTNN